MIGLTIITNTGNYWNTMFRGTYEQAESYFLGKRFNVGIVDDYFETVVEIRRV